LIKLYHQAIAVWGERGDRPQLRVGCVRRETIFNSNQPFKIAP